MSRLRRFFISALALSAATVALAVPAQTANAAGTVTKVIVWGDSMSLAWPAYLPPLLGVPVEGRGVGGEDVQQTQARFQSWMNSATQAQINTTGHLCWCGHVNNNPQHVGTAKDANSIVPTLVAMRNYNPPGKTGVPAGFFEPIGLQNGPDAPQGSAGYDQLINSPPYDVVNAGTAVNERMLVAFGDAYAEVRRYLVTDGLAVAHITPTDTDEANIAVDVPPESLRRASTPNDAHLSEAGKQVTASHLNDLLRQDGWIAPSQGLPSTTTAGSTDNPSDYGQSIRFTASVRPAAGQAGTPTGTVQFFVNGRPALAPFAVPPSGDVVSSPTAGLTQAQNSIQAVYSGDRTFASSSDSFAQVVNFGAKLATATVISSSMNPAPRGAFIRISATVRNASGQSGPVPTGSVQFSLDGNPFGAAVKLNASGVAVSPPGRMTVGQHVITASYSGDSRYNPSNGGPFTQTVTR